mgnify:CR=1 FL=1
MKVSFKEVKSGLKNEIFVDEVYVGYVEINLWNQKWKIYPQFNFSSMEQDILYVEFSSCYKAGKAMADLYCRAFMLYGYENDDYDYKNTDTQPTDMRGIWGTSSTGP